MVVFHLHSIDQRLVAHPPSEPYVHSSRHTAQASRWGVQVAVRQVSLRMRAFARMARGVYEACSLAIRSARRPVVGEIAGGYRFPGDLQPPVVPTPWGDCGGWSAVSRCLPA